MLCRTQIRLFFIILFDFFTYPCGESSKPNMEQEFTNTDNVEPDDVIDSSDHDKERKDNAYSTTTEAVGGDCLQRPCSPPISGDTKENHYNNHRGACNVQYDAKTASPQNHIQIVCIAKSDDIPIDTENEDNMVCDATDEPDTKLSSPPRHDKQNNTKVVLTPLKMLGNLRRHNWIFTTSGIQSKIHKVHLFIC